MNVMRRSSSGSSDDTSDDNDDGDDGEVRRPSKRRLVFESRDVKRTSLNGGLAGDDGTDDDDNDANDSDNDEQRDMYAEHHGDARHEKTKFTGVYVVHPLRRPPPHYTFSDPQSRNNDLQLLHADGLTRLYENEPSHVRI
jgi:hypothetical protein